LIAGRDDGGIRKLLGTDPMEMGRRKDFLITDSRVRNAQFSPQTALRRSRRFRRSGLIERSVLIFVHTAWLVLKVHRVSATVQVLRIAIAA
jgi:hypothetical protein